MIGLYNTFFYEPLFNALIWLYNVIPGSDIGVAIVVLTILIKIVLFPLSLQSIRSQKALQEIQPKVQEIQKKYKNDKEKLAQELMGLYKENKVNPMSSCLPLLIQFPFLIAIYRVFLDGLASENFDIIYPFIQNPGHINPITLGLVDLSEPNIVLALLAGAAQFWQSKMMFAKQAPQPKGNKIPGAKDENLLSGMNKQMIYFMPIITVVIGMTLPGGLALYWLMTTFLMALQQWFMFRKKKEAVAVTSSEDQVAVSEEKRIIELDSSAVKEQESEPAPQKEAEPGQDSRSEPDQQSKE